MAAHEQEELNLVRPTSSDERAAWQKPQWRIIDAREAEAAFTTPSADGGFNHS
ncbi:MAG: hypothetical protein ACREJM_11420 [Candidatus Saccharimonadales bacterium]